MSVQGKCERSIEQSWYNSKEIEATINVIKRLMPPKSAKEGLRQIAQSDIGVVTPYRKQKFKLLQRLRYLNFDEVMVGTAEIFQGKEKPVMIISTVRSDGELGFVEDPRVSQINSIDFHGFKSYLPFIDLAFECCYYPCKVFACDYR